MSIYSIKSNRIKVYSHISLSISLSKVITDLFPILSWNNANKKLFNSRWKIISHLSLDIYCFWQCQTLFYINPRDLHLFCVIIKSNVKKVLLFSSLISADKYDKFFFIKSHFSTFDKIISVNRLAVGLLDRAYRLGLESDYAWG